MRDPDGAVDEDHRYLFQCRPWRMASRLPFQPVPFSSFKAVT
jgi:hypothetical protein